MRAFEGQPPEVEILYVSHSGLVSGAEGALLDLVEALPAHVTPIVACPPGPLADLVRRIGVRVVELPEAAGSLRIDSYQAAAASLRIILAGRALRKAIREVRPDVLHANTLRAGLVTACANLPHRTPTILHVHDVMPRTRAASLVGRVLRSTGDVYIAVSDYAAERFLDEDERARERVRVFYNPLDVARFSLTGLSRRQARAQLGFSDDVPVIGLVAQITPWKGQETAIRMLKLVHDHHPDARLLLVGEPKFVGASVRFDNLAYLQSLHELVETLHLQNHVGFWGERGDVPAIMRGIDVLVCPSWEEPFGRSVIEAMAVGTAVVATNLGGPAEVIEDGVDGRLAPPDDARAWADTVTELLANPNAREAMGQRASEKVRTLFDRDEYAAKVVAVYEEVLAVRAHDRAAERGPGSRHPSASASPRSPRLRVLFVEHAAEIGGAQHSLLELLRTLVADHDVKVACPEGSLAQEIRSLKVPVAVIPASQLTFKLSFPASLTEGVRAVAARAAVYSCMRRYRPNLVHANTLRAGLLAPRGRSSTPLVVHCRDLLPAGVVGDTVGRATTRRSTAVIAVSKAAAARVAGPRWRQHAVVVVDNPVDTVRFDPALFDSHAIRTALGVDGGQPVLGLIAQITPWKGQTRAVNVLARLRETHPTAMLLIVGEAKFVTRATSFDNRSYQRQLADAIASLDLGGAVRLLGERQDVERIISALDVLLVPSTEEPFGRTVIEALCMDVPVVATDAGGPAEVIRPGIDGELLAPDDYDGWAAAIGRVIGGGQGADSRPYAVERFNAFRHRSAVLKVYDQVLQRSATPEPSASASAPSGSGALDLPS